MRGKADPEADELAAAALAEADKIEEDLWRDDVREAVRLLERFPTEREGQLATVWLYWASGGVLNVMSLEAEWGDAFDDHIDALRKLREASDRRQRREEAETRRQHEHTALTAAYGKGGAASSPPEVRCMPELGRPGISRRRSLR